MSNLPPVLPTGTQVVSHIDITNSAGDVTFAAGVVGVIVKAPTDAHHAYRVCFMDGTEQSLKRCQFSVHSHHMNFQYVSLRSVWRICGSWR